MLTLRTRIGLTQVSLGELLEVSRRAVAEWEGGLAYPKAEHLKAFPALGVRQQAFPAGREEEQIRAFWLAAHQKVLLDEAWLHDLLAPPAPVQLFPPAETPVAHTGSSPAAFPRVDWVGALDVSHFAGREVEVAELIQWIVQERCCLIALLGMGGIDKSTLASYLGQRLAPHFEAVLWRSVRDAPSCEELVADCITFFSETPPAEFPTSLEQRITHLVARLQASRCLLVLDNFETLPSSGDREGSYLPGYEGYGRLIGRLAEAAHQSCVLLTSRERPKEIEALKGARSPVRSLRLQGVDDQTTRVLLSDKGLQRYACRLAAPRGQLRGQSAGPQNRGAGHLRPLRWRSRPLPAGGGTDLQRRPTAAAPAGGAALAPGAPAAYLARCAARVDEARHPRAGPASQGAALAGVGGAGGALVERGQQASFSLQSVVMEYLTDELGERFSKEIVLSEPQQLRQVALAQAHAKDYVREIQVRLLVQPLLERLRAELGADAQIEAHLLRLLSQFRAEDAATRGYGPANVITLLTALRGHLRGLDLSRLALRGVYLQGVELQDSNLAFARLEECLLTQSFDALTTLATRLSDQYWATAGRRGQVRVWRERGNVLHLSWQAHSATVYALASSPDERLLASGSWDGSLKLWNVESGGLLWSDWQTRATIEDLAFSPDGGLLASGGLDGNVRLWDAKLGTLLEELPHPGPVYALAWSPDGHVLASGDFVGTVRLWQRQPTGTAGCIQTLSGHSSWMRGLAFAPDGSLLVSASRDGSLKLWEVSSGRCLQTLSRQAEQGHTAFVNRVAWSPDGGTLVSGGSDRTIWLWEARSGTCRAVLHGHSADVRGLAFTPDSRQLLSSSEDGTLRLWDVERAQCVRVLQGYPASLYDLDWSPDGTELASVGAERVVSLW
jgi:WD40 repeat protein/transcriptional regulator with XRE-family HTH domain